MSYLYTLDPKVGSIYVLGGLRKARNGPEPAFASLLSGVAGLGGLVPVLWSSTFNR